MKTTLTKNKNSMTLAAAGIFAFAGAVLGTSLSEVRIPKQSDWTEHGVVIESGKSGSWDARFYGQMSPCTAIKKNGIFYLYYIGANGNRPTDGGPGNRALGVATSSDGIHFTKCSDNPIVTHQPAKNVEEGVFSAGGMIDKNGELLLYYGAIWAENVSTEEVHCCVALAQSRDAKKFRDCGYILAWNDRPCGDTEMKSSHWGPTTQVGGITYIT